MQLNDKIYFSIAVAIYGISVVYSAFLWRRGFREHNRANYLFFLVGLAFHTVAMLKRGFSLSRCPVNNLYEATLFLNWTIVAGYLVLGAVPKMRFLGAFASPVVFGLGVFALMPGLDAKGPNPEIVTVWSSLHASLVLLAYGAFGMASVAAIMYLVQERDLKIHKLRAVVSFMPPIQRLESVTGQSLIAGFVMLTAGLVVGMIYFKTAPGIKTGPDPKILWSILVWFIYLGLLLMKWKFDRGGRRFAWGALCSFLFIVLTFWGVNMLSPIHH